MKLSTNSNLYIHLTLTVRNSVSSNDLKASKLWVCKRFTLAAKEIPFKCSQTKPGHKY